MTVRLISGSTSVDVKRKREKHLLGGLQVRWFMFYHVVNREIRSPTTLCFAKHHNFMQLHVMNNFVRGGVTGITFFEGISSLFSSKIIKITQHISKCVPSHRQT